MLDALGSNKNDDGETFAAFNWHCLSAPVQPQSVNNIFVRSNTNIRIFDERMMVKG